MRFRRLGNTELLVSEIGLGTWSLASDWWGHCDDPDQMIGTALDCGINFFDTAPVYGEAALGETMLRSVLASRRDEIVLTTKCGYDTSRPRPAGQREHPQDFSPAAVRQQCDESLARMGIDHIDLYQLHNARIDPILADDLWAELASLRAEGKIRELGVALGPAIGWVEEGNRASDERPICSLQTVFNVLEQEPGLTFAHRARVRDGACSLIARVPHASDALSGRVTPDTVFPKGDHRAHRNRDNMLDNFEKAETLAFLWSPETGRTQGQAAIAGILAHTEFATVLPTVTDVDEVREYAAASDLALTDDEHRATSELYERNFDHEDRFTMVMKSSV
jgi:aryl-alcohol dehydrogenase-like predicted oxidoreductase